MKNLRLFVSSSRGQFLGVSGSGWSVDVRYVFGEVHYDVRCAFVLGSGRGRFVDRY
jgi:hypothetical protein